jgi:hypothetical protein
MTRNNPRIVEAGLTYDDFTFDFKLLTSQESRIFATVKEENQKYAGIIVYYYKCPNVEIQVTESKYSPLFVADSQMAPSARLRLISNLIFT